MDGALTPNATGAVNGLVPGLYPITYTVSNTAGNAAKPVTRLVIVLSDQAPPNIILSGNALVELEVGSDFTDPGAQADDAVDGEVDVTITGSVDTGTIGAYSLIYKASDASGNSATPVVRTIVSGGHNATSDLSQWFGQGRSAPKYDLHRRWCHRHRIITTPLSSLATKGQIDTAQAGIQVLTYTASDSSCTKLPVTRVVVVVSDAPPVVTLNGEKDIFFE